MVCRISWKRGVAALVFLAAAALCLILAMSSCQKSGGGAEAPVVTGFECDVALTYRDMEITGHLTRLNAGTLTLAFTEPASLKDMTMMWDGENISMKMYGLTFGVDPSEIPESALGKGIVAPVRPGERPPSLAEGALPEPERGFLQFCRQDLLTIPAAGRPAPRFSLSRPLLDGLFGEAAAYSGRDGPPLLRRGEKHGMIRLQRAGRAEEEWGWTTGPSAFLIRGWAA